MVGFQDDSLTAGQHLLHPVGHTARVGHVADRNAAELKAVAHRGAAVVQSRERPHRHVADRRGEVRLPVQHQTAAQRLRLTVAVAHGAVQQHMHRERVFPCQHLQRGDMVAVLVRDKNGIQLLGRHPQLPERCRQRAGTAPRVDENARGRRFQIGGVALRAGIERTEAVGDGIQCLQHSAVSLLKPVFNIVEPEEQVHRLCQEHEHEREE